MFHVELVFTLDQIIQNRWGCGRKEILYGLFSNGVNDLLNLISLAYVVDSPYERKSENNRNLILHKGIKIKMTPVYIKMTR